MRPSALMEKTKEWAYRHRIFGETLAHVEVVGLSEEAMSICPFLEFECNYCGSWIRNTLHMPIVEKYYAILWVPEKKYPAYAHCGEILRNTVGPREEISCICPLRRMDM